MSIEGSVTRLLNDPKELDTLLKRVLEDLRKLARRAMRGATNSLVEPDDLVSEAAFNVLINKQRTWSRREEFFAWMAVTMRHRFIDYCRKEHPAKQLTPNSPVPARGAAPDEPVEFREVTEFIFTHLQQLAHESPVVAEVLQLHLFGAEDGVPLPIADIIRLLGLAPGAAYRARLKGLEKLRWVLQQAGIQALTK